MELNTYSRRKISAGTWAIFAAGLAVIAFGGYLMTSFGQFAMMAGVLVMIGAPALAFRLERRLWKRSKTVRIYTDEVQVREGEKLLAAVPWSEIVSFSEENMWLISGHRVVIETSEGQRWNMLMRAPALQILRSGLRILAPGHCRVSQRHRRMIKNPVRLMKWSAGLTVGLILFLMLLPQNLVFLAPLGYLVFLTIPTFIYTLFELPRRAFSREWSLRDAARSATDLLRILPIMDSEYHVFRYADPDRLIVEAERTRARMALLRTLFMVLSVALAWTVFFFAGTATVLLTGMLLIGLLIAWLVIEFGAHDGIRAASAARHRFIIDNRRLYLHRDGGRKECHFRKAVSGIGEQEMVEVLCDGERIHLAPSMMLEEDWLKESQSTGHFSAEAQGWSVLPGQQSRQDDEDEGPETEEVAVT